MGAVKVELELPEDALTSAHITRKRASVELRKIIALELFREEVISLGKGAEIAGMCVADFMDLTAQKEIPLHYTEENLQDDLKWARESKK